MVEQTLVVRDDEERAVLGAEPIDALGDDAERVDVEAGIRLVEDAHLRGEERHLQDLHALLLAAGEADVQRALQHVLVDAELLGRAVDRLDEGGGLQFVLAARAALRVHRGLEEGHRGDAGDLQRILEGEEQAGGGAGVRLHREDVLAVQQDLAVEDLVILLAGDDIAERGLAGAVRPHDGGDFSIVDREREPVEDRLVLVGDLDVQVADFEHGVRPW